MTGHRAERVADQIRRLLGRLLIELRDPRIGFVTLTEVTLSPDLRYARVYVTLLEERERDEALAALNRAAPFLRRALAREAGLRFTPELRFVYDTAVERGTRVARILGALHDEASDGHEEAPDAPPGSDEPADRE